MRQRGGGVRKEFGFGEKEVIMSSTVEEPWQFELSLREHPVKLCMAKVVIVLLLFFLPFLFIVPFLAVRRVALPLDFAVRIAISA